MGLLRGVARTAAVAGTATAVSNRVSRRQANRWSNSDQQAAAQQQAAAPAAPEDNLTAQLEELAQLRNQGILTEDEFTAKKKQLLGV